MTSIPDLVKELKREASRPSVSRAYVEPIFHKLVKIFSLKFFRKVGVKPSAELVTTLTSLFAGLGSEDSTTVTCAEVCSPHLREV